MTELPAEEAVLRLNTGEINILELVQSQPNIAEDFAEAMEIKGIADPTEKDAVEWLNAVEEKLYKNPIDHE